MRFIVGAQLPRSLAVFLRGKKLDAIHTSELPDGNETPDSEIIRISLAEGRIVVSKDGDFYDRFTARREPYKLLHIRTGNIRNAALIQVFERNLDAIVRELEEADVVELDQRYLIALN